MMNITITTTADQVLRVDICKAYEFVEKLYDHSEFGYTWRVRNGAIVRMECYLRQYVHYRTSPNSPFSRREGLVDVPELTNNTALAYLKRGSIGNDHDHANYFENADNLTWQLEQAFPSHRALKLQTLQEVINQ